MKMQMSKFKEDKKTKTDLIDQLNDDLIGKQKEHETMVATVDELQAALLDKHHMLEEIQNKQKIVADSLHIEQNQSLIDQWKFLTNEQEKLQIQLNKNSADLENSKK